MSKHKLTKEQSKAILRIREYFEKRLSSSNEMLPLFKNDLSI
jgi:hypothetical protein